MAGGKETPRQKMIGMMYLVLTAILALNVSQTILDAFVAIEENVQKANLTELYRGDERKSVIAETTLDSTEPQRAKRAEFLMTVIDKLDQMTTERIKFIDDLKLTILKDCGEDVESIGKKESILMEKYDPQVNPLKPIRMNLQRVEGKDKYDEVMHLLIQEDIRRPGEKGMELWNSLLSYRKSLTELIVSSHAKNVEGDFVKDDKYHFTAPMINSLENQDELDQLLKISMEAGNIHPDDKGVVLEIYKSLTKEEYSDVNEVEGVHWIGKTFDHSPSVAAIASLSSLQNDILKARANAIILLRSRISGDTYSFNKIIPLATGPEVVNQGDAFQVGITMAAYDSDKQPIVTMNGQEIANVQNGQAVVDLTGTNGTMDLKGTITIKNKAGIAKTMDWKKKVFVMKPSGSIEMPEFNMLYRRYKNKVNATASGFPETVLTGSGVIIKRTSEGYEVTPSGNGRTAQLIVSGKTEDGKITRLKTINYKVSRLPKPTLYLGASASDERVTWQNTVLNARFPPEIPLNVTFRVVSWEVSVEGARTVSGTGSNIAVAQPLIKSAKTGAVIRISTWIVQDGMRERLSGTYIKA